MGALLCAEGPLRRAVLARQARRREHFAPAAVEATLRRYVDSL